MISSIKGNE
ncbi:Protein of unknown function [Bacillus cytotoxicus]|uniref:Uncharacterized protein n=1 Tax=Bacillus cytotoxicus TaxID=580165 RepID=A0AAX2CI55_9BACI|nr:Protein of unknown function [Bacillus cytotoxicus]SCN38756.1 Protein of unknown function [Bacillus cytotoxicus]